MEILFFISPLFFAGIVHHFFIIRYNFCTFLAHPIDGGLHIFGNKKTFRGFIFMTALTGFFLWVLNFYFLIDLKFHTFLSGMVLGFFYSLGELPNSFLKRRLGIKESILPKNKFYIIFKILDHIDSILGAIFGLFIIYNPSKILIINLFILGSLLHFIVDLILRKYSYKKYLKSKNNF